MRSVYKSISPALLMILSIAVLLFVSQSQVPPASAHAYPSYEMGIGILDFRESDHTANMSIHFLADFEMKEGKPGLYGMDLENRWNRITGDYVHQEKNGTLEDGGIGRWVFDFSIRAHAYGASEFYPYDSWMFNLTLSTPLLHEANSTNFSGFVNPSRGIPGWNFEGAETFRLTHFSYDDSATVTIVLRRAGWQTVHVQVIPLILLLMLGMTVLIPSKDLSTKATVYTSVIFFVAALLFNLKDFVSPLRSGLSFAETSFYCLFIFASMFLVFAVIENVYTVKEGMLYLPSARGRIALQILMRLLILTFVWYILYSFVSSYQNMASPYWWVSFPMFDTLFVPALSVGLGVLGSMAALLYRAYATRQISCLHRSNESGLSKAEVRAFNLNRKALAKALENSFLIVVALWLGYWFSIATSMIKSQPEIRVALMALLTFVVLVPLAYFVEDYVTRLDKH